MYSAPIYCPIISKLNLLLIGPPVPAGVIAGIVIGVVVGLGLFFGIFCHVCNVTKNDY